MAGDFARGHDLKEIRAMGDVRDVESLFARCSRMMMTITTLPQPVIARVHGIATAAGCQLVATCDLAVASTAAAFATPGVNIGAFCSTPGVALGRAVARKHAMEMLFTGETIGALRAYEIGLVNRVVSPEALDAEVDTLSRRIASKSWPRSRPASRSSTVSSRCRPATPTTCPAAPLPATFSVRTARKVWTHSSASAHRCGRIALRLESEQKGRRVCQSTSFAECVKAGRLSGRPPTPP